MMYTKVTHPRSANLLLYKYSHISFDFIFCMKHTDIKIDKIIQKLTKHYITRLLVIHE